MNYIDKDLCIWNTDKIITSEIDINTNLYLIKDNIVHIFYTKIYKNPIYNEDFNKFESRNELLFSLYVNNFKGRFNMDIYSRLEKCCEFCFNISKNTACIKNLQFSDIIICKDCYSNKQKENHYINDRSFKSINSINIEMIKRVNNNLFYFYSIQQIYNDFSYIKLLSSRWYQVTNSKLCQLCHKNEKCFKLECQECHNFSLKQYSIIYTKPKYLELTEFLHIDIIKVILSFYITLMEFDDIDIYNFKCYLKSISDKPIVLPDKHPDPSISSNLIHFDPSLLNTNDDSNNPKYTKLIRANLIKDNLVDYDSDDQDLINYDDDCDFNDIDF